MIRTLSVIVPAYNEERTIKTILDRLFEVELIGGITVEVIVVNDCSRDRTDEVVTNYLSANPDRQIQYHKHEPRKASNHPQTEKGFKRQNQRCGCGNRHK